MIKHFAMDFISNFLSKYKSNVLSIFYFVKQWFVAGDKFSKAGIFKTIENYQLLNKVMK